jgi:flagellar protein FliJ
MKKYKFRLESVLKIRKFKEDRVKIEVGEILKKINETNEQIILIDNSIAEAYSSQDALLREPSTGTMAQFFPYYIEGRNRDKEQKERELDALNRAYQEKVQELAKARGDVKVLDKMKEKKKIAHNKEQEKKRQEDIDDILRMRQPNDIKEA